MITVLLAAWNGEAYIREQLDSILGQKGLGKGCGLAEVFLMISDDGSTDGTREILEQYREKYPEQILLCHRSPKRKEMDLADGIPAAAGNFFWLLECAAAKVDGVEDEYFMLSDQDDVWKENKAAVLLKEMKCLEAKHGADHPILIHSDMEVVDVNLKTIHPSFFKYQNCNPERVGFSELLVENSVTGGAVMMNRALVKLLKKRPAACFMHDWWIALTASCFGTISYIQDPLYLYRQHGNNTLGAKQTGSLKAMAARTGELVRGALARTGKNGKPDILTVGEPVPEKTGDPVEKNYRMMAAQAHAFGKMYGDRMSEEQKAILRAYLALRYQSPLGRFKNIMRNRFFKSSKIQTLAQCVTIPRPDDGNWPI